MPATTATILPTHTPALFAAAVSAAARRLREGDVVALPTETVYGLAANAFSAAAVEKIYAVKDRPAANPLIVHVANQAMAAACVSDFPPLAEKLARAFWPGPLTLVLPRSEKIPPIVTAGGPTVAIRWPSHPFIQAVIRACDFPLAAPSANLANQISPTSALHVAKSLGHKISLIIDGGQSQVGIESTVLDLTCQPPRILRPGIIHAESLLAVTGALAGNDTADPDVLRSPGQFKKHYAPRARLLILDWSDAADLQEKIHAAGETEGGTQVIAHTRIPFSPAFSRVSVIPHDVEAFARAIYAELHQADDSGARLIVIEKLPEGPAWQGIADRLTRAAS